MEKDIKHLNTIAWVHYAFAGLNSLFLVLVLFYVLFVRFMLATDAIRIGFLLVTGAADDSIRILDGKIPTSLFVYSVSLAVCGFLSLLLLAGAVSNFYCGKFMAEQKHYMFCLIVTALTITSFPIGTAIGAYSLVILLRPHVKELFEKIDEDPARGVREPLTLLSRSLVFYGLASVGWVLVPVSILTAALTYQFGDYVDVTVSYNSKMNAAIMVGSAAFVVAGFGLSVCTVLAGRFVKSYSKFYFCFAVAVLNTLFAPFGTIVGLFTIYTLLKDSVRMEFFENKKGVIR